MFAQMLANGLVNGLSYAMLAVGFALIYNTTRVFHIAYGATFAAGAFVFYYCFVPLSLAMPLAVAVCLAITSLLGIGLDRLVYAPLARSNATPLVALLSSLGVYLVVMNSIALLFGSNSKVLLPGAQAHCRLAGFVLTHTQIATAATSFVVIPGVLLWLRFSRYGRLVIAIRDNPDLAVVLGTDLGVARALVFAVGSFLCGISAALYALDIGIDPGIGMPALLIAAVALIVGGVGTFGGPVVGALLLGIIRSVIAGFISTKWMDAGTYAVLILFLLLRPEGLLGRRRRIEEAI